MDFIFGNGNPFFAKALYDMICFVFGNGASGKLVEIMKKVLDASSAVLQKSSMGPYMDLFIGIANSLVVIFFLIHTIEHASSDTLTLEKFTLLFAKLIVGVSLIIYIKDIIPELFNLMKEIFNLVDSNFSSTATSSAIEIFGSSPPKEWNDKIAADFVTIYGKPFFQATVFEFLGILLLIVPSLVGWAAIGLGIFLCISTSIRLIVYGVMSPLAVTQCFEPGGRNQAIRYLKKFAATGLSFALFIIILWASNKLSLSVITSVNKSVAENGINATNLNSVISFSNFGQLALITIINFGGIGAMAGARQIANDIMGV